VTQAGVPASGMLRPLSLGETLDRAVTLVVRHARSFALTGLVYVLPLAVMQYFIRKTTAGSYQQLLAQIQGHPSNPDLAAFPWGWFAALIAFSSVFVPFVVTAYAAAVAALYSGRAPDWRPAYLPGLRKAGSILLAEVICGAILVGAVMAGSFALVISTSIVILIARFAAPIGIVLGIIAALAMIAFALFVGAVYLALWFAVLAIALEDTGVTAAFSRGFARIFARGEFGRALLMCLSFFAIYLMNFMLSAGVSMLLLTSAKLQPLDVVLQGVLQLFFLALFATLLGVYYFDVRVRREGLDIQRQLEELDAAARA